MTHFFVSHCRGALRCVALAFCLVHGGCALAQTSVPPLFVTASRSAQPLTDLLADVTLIGPEEIARAGPGGLTALLQRQPGIEVVANGGPGSTSGVFMRGANTAQTLVLVDGLRVSSSTTGTTPLEAIPLDQIDHIEILRGPASSLYGADAIGGVIQIFTRRGGGAFAANASAGYGTYNTSSVYGGVSGNGGDGAWRYALQAGHRQSDGFNAIFNPKNFSYNPDRDGYRNDNVGGSLSFRFAPEQEISAQAFRSRLNAQFDAGPGFDDRTVTTVESYSIASRNRLTGFWTSELSAGETRDDSNSVTGFGPSRFLTRQRLYSWQNELMPSYGHLTVLAERREERIDSDTAFDVTSRNTNSVAGIYQLRDGPQLAQASLRRDDSSQFGARTTGTVAYGYAFAPGLRATASFGTAFKAPTFNDLYFPGFSNPGLRPETARNAELELRYSGDTLSAGLVAYRNRVRDLIVFECDANFNCAPQNVANATLEGVTAEFGGHVGEFSAKGSLDLQKPTDDSNGFLLPRRARRHAAFSLIQDTGPLRVDAEVVASSARFDDAANMRRMGGYALLNLTAEYRFGNRWTIFARLDNALDKHYELAADFNTAGSNAFVGVRWLY
ncbi:MAG TPA: TonB-dependent receptor [Casimicrobiaceae bacterium]|nr:TonB-dependent receptor [Casimicrobiaceae bacterium]